MQPANLSLFSSALARQSCISVLPCSSHLTTTGSNPACTHDAGFVPWAEAGISSTLRSGACCASQARITTKPVYSPAAPDVGCNVQASKPVIWQSICFSSSSIWIYPCACSCGTNGWIDKNPGKVIGSIAEAGLSFIVHEPSGIMECVRLISLRAKRCMYRIISVSVWYFWNTSAFR